MNGALAAAAVAGLAMIAAAGVLAGYRRRDPVPIRAFGDPLEDRRLALERSLEDLEDAHAAGALDEAEFVRLRGETRSRLALVDAATRAREASTSVAADAPRAPMRIPTWAVGVLLVGVVSAVVLSSLTREANAPAATPPASDAADPFVFFERRVAQHPRDLAARLDLAHRYLDAGRIEDALDEYSVALEIAPDDAEAHAHIGLILLAGEHPQEALEQVDQALAAAPDYPEALFFRGVILLDGLDRPKQALVPLRRYLEVAPFGAERSTVEGLIDRAVGS